MKRDPSLVRLSRDHHRGLVVAIRVEKEAPSADEAELARLRAEVLDFWHTGLLPHFRAECECILARLVRQLALDDAMITRTEADHLKLNSLFVAMEDGAGIEESRQIILEMGTLLRDHIRWEESVLFDRTQTMLSAAELQLLGNDIAERIPEVPAPPSWAPR